MSFSLSNKNKEKEEAHKGDHTKTKDIEIEEGDHTKPKDREKEEKDDHSDPQEKEEKDDHSESEKDDHSESEKDDKIFSITFSLLTIILILTCLGLVIWQIKTLNKFQIDTHINNNLSEIDTAIQNASLGSVDSFIFQNYLTSCSMLIVITLWLYDILLTVLNMHIITKSLYRKSSIMVPRCYWKHIDPRVDFIYSYLVEAFGILVLFSNWASYYSLVGLLDNDFDIFLILVCVQTSVYMPVMLMIQSSNIGAQFATDYLKVFVLPDFGSEVKKTLLRSLRWSTLEMEYETKEFLKEEISDLKKRISSLEAEISSMKKNITKKKYSN